MRPIRTTRLALALATSACCLGGLGACAYPVARHDPAVAIVVPPAWSTPHQPPVPDAGSLAQWWQGCSDPLLLQLVTQALQANTDVRIAESALAQARAGRDLAAAQLWPVLDGNASARASTTGTQHATLFAASADAGWNPDLFGANRNALRATLAQLDASADRAGSVRVTVASEVGVGYILLRSTQARLQLAREGLASQQQTLQIVQWRRQAGLASELEVDQADAAAAQTEALVPLLQSGESQAAHALAVLTGQSPASLDDLLAQTQPVPLCNAKFALGIPADTLRQRADVRASEQLVSAAWAQVAQARAARWPDFSLGGSIGTSASRIAALGTGASALSAVLATVTLPLFDGGARSATVRLRQAQLQQASVTYDATVLAALAEVEDTLAALRSDEPRVQSLERAAASALAAAQLAQLRFESGLVDFQVVLDTQRTQLSAQDALAAARAQLASDEVRLYTSLGGGWHEENPWTPR